MALFRGKGVPTSVLVALAIIWVYDVAKIHLPQIVSGYPGDTYTLEAGLTAAMNQPRWWMTAHAAVGCVVLLMWLAQASQEVRKWSPAFHRWNGRLSILLWLPMGILTPIRAFSMSQTEKTMETLTRCLISIFAVLVISWITVGWASIAVWKNVGLHRQCMIRVLTGTICFIVLSRKWLALLKNYIWPSAWWFDVGTWIAFPVVLGIVEGVPYLMEKSFGATHEYRLLGFIKLWTKPKSGAEPAAEHTLASDHRSSKGHTQTASLRQFARGGS